jgi:hypothetical protein
MKRIKLLQFAVLFASTSHAQITSPAPYCSAGYDDAFGPPKHYISNVSIGTLNNTSGTTPSPLPHYTYYNNIAAPTLAKGSTYTLSVTHDPDSTQGYPNTMHWIAAYIDFNHNNIFDSSELVLSWIVSVNPHLSNPTTATVTIPANALSGVTRMRVLVTEDDYVNYPTPCADTFFESGETEDYNVNITNGNSSVNNVTEETETIIYPNPAKDHFFIDHSFVDGSIRITDVQGKLVQETMITNERINISNLKPGFYFVTVIKGAYSSTQKMFVEK